ncbi:MAG: hypothetical protein QOJ51_4097 [Acidobacteriaceae bacterium]|nr:hypothetical protein [Acidobacteriaceae bacterium]
MTLAAFLRAGGVPFPRSTSAPPGSNGWVPPGACSFKVYCVESRRHGSVDFDPGPVLIGTVQFTATDGMEDQQGEEEKALDHLASHSPQAARHPVLGFVT